MTKGEFEPIFQSFKEVAELDIEGQEKQELIEVVLLESREILEAVSQEIASMDSDYFSLDSYYEIQEIILEYQTLLSSLGVENEKINNLLLGLMDLLNEKNPIAQVANKNQGNVLIHSSDIQSLDNLLDLQSETAEICTTAGSLREKGDVFIPKKKAIHAGIIFNPAEAKTWFSRDVGSRRQRGKRVLEDRFFQFQCASMNEALKKKINGRRVEAWIDAKKSNPIALLVIDNEQEERILALSRQSNLPVVYNSQLYE